MLLSHLAYLCLYVQAAKQQTVLLLKFAVIYSFLWALPTPTTFEKVDQTFLVLKAENLIVASIRCSTETNLNRNSLEFSQKQKCAAIMQAHFMKR